jgi:uncharacterized protein GlcG (DUF336 family)
MKTKSMLTSEDVKKIAAAAEQHARDNNWAVVIAVTDEGGHLLNLHRLDQAPAASVDVAIGKARTSALGRRESKGYEEMINGGRTAFLSAPMTAMLEGGIPIVIDGEVIGAVGVSGVKADQDAAIARAGVAALG